MENATEPRYPIRFRTSDGDLWDVDWRDIELAMKRDPEGRTVPSPCRNVLMLTAEDYVFLWQSGIGTGGE